MEKHPLLQIKDFSIALKNNNQTLLNELNLTIETNEIIGIVGESGSGKSITALSIMGLLNANVFQISKGAIPTYR